MNMRVAIFLGLFLGCCFLFFSMAESRVLEKMLHHTRENLELAARERNRRNRRELKLAGGRPTIWKRLEQQLDYSGITICYPYITVERWCCSNVLLLSMGFLLGVLFFGAVMGGMAVVVFAVLLQVLLLEMLRQRNLKLFHRELSKFLDFLGNYSLTAGEVSGVFRQVARYMEKPLSILLERCSVEAQTTGDVSLALLSMAERIEHPKFKELLRNMEISLHYCADFSALVQSSRRTVREYEQMKTQRQGMLREATINMLLLLAMSGIVLMTVDGLIEVSIWSIVLATWPGRMALATVAGIVLMFLGQLRRNGG